LPKLSSFLSSYDDTEDKEEEEIEEEIEERIAERDVEHAFITLFNYETISINNLIRERVEYESILEEDAFGSF
jgi:hypothetical protein